MADWAIKNQPNELVLPEGTDLLRIHDDSTNGEKKISLDSLFANYSGATKVQSAGSDALDVTGISTILADTSGGSVIIGGLSNGVTGQKVTFVHNVLGATLTIEDNEGTGDQKLHTIAGTDLSFTDYGGATFYFNGTLWIQVG